jgi:fumarate reductase subunit D
MAKSNKPMVWGPFAAGGTLTAFLTPVLIVLSLLAALGHPPAVFSYESMHALAAHWAGKVAFAGVIGLSLWSAAHRMRITAYDLGVRADALVAALVYLAALGCTGAAIYYLLQI